MDRPVPESDKCEYNVVAVEIHQQSLTSSDVSFALSLTGNPAPARPHLALVRLADEVVLYSSDNKTAHQLLIVGHDGDRIQVYNPHGYTVWVKEEDFINGKMGAVGPLTPGEIEMAGAISTIPSVPLRTWEYWSIRLEKRGGMPPRGRTSAATAKRPSSRPGRQTARRGKVKRRNTR